MGTLCAMRRIFKLNGSGAFVHVERKTSFFGFREESISTVSSSSFLLDTRRWQSTTNSGTATAASGVSAGTTREKQGATETASTTTSTTRIVSSPLAAAAAGISIGRGSQTTTTTSRTMQINTTKAASTTAPLSPLPAAPPSSGGFTVASWGIPRGVGGVAMPVKMAPPSSSSSSSSSSPLLSNNINNSNIKPVMPLSGGAALLRDKANSLANNNNRTSNNINNVAGGGGGGGGRHPTPTSGIGGITDLLSIAREANTNRLRGAGGGASRFLDGSAVTPSSSSSSNSNSNSNNNNNNMTSSSMATSSSNTGANHTSNNNNPRSSSSFSNSRYPSSSSSSSSSSNRPSHFSRFHANPTSNMVVGAGPGGLAFPQGPNDSSSSSSSSDTGSSSSSSSTANNNNDNSNNDTSDAYRNRNTFSDEAGAAGRNEYTSRRATLVSTRGSVFDDPPPTFSSSSSSSLPSSAGRTPAARKSLGAFGGAFGGSKGGTGATSSFAARKMRKLTASQKIAKGREIARISRQVLIKDNMTPRDLAEAMGVKLPRILSKLAELGESVNKDDGIIDPDTAEIIAQDARMQTKRVDGKLADRVRTIPPSIEEMIAAGIPERPPIVTVMGHVDHGKTSLLDALRGTRVAEGEAGGITQGVAAFSVAMRVESSGTGQVRPPGGKANKKNSNKKNVAVPQAATKKEDHKKKNKKEGTSENVGETIPTPPTPTTAPTSAVDVMTFIDTPGHALFSSMRKRGSSVTDIVVLVVDGKDGVMPQTKECVKLILEAGIPTVVAATKCDVVEPEVACERVSKQLLELGLATEAFGGDAPIVAVSARTGVGLSALKDAIALQSELSGLRADVKAPGEAVVMDSRMIKGQGAVVDAIVMWGVLRVGDVIVAGNETGRVRALLTDAVGANSLNKRLALSPDGSVSVSASSVTTSSSKGSHKKGGGPSSSGSNNTKHASDSGSFSSGDASDSPNSGSFAITPVNEAPPGTPVRVLGLKGCPPAGAEVLVVVDEDAAKAVIDGRLRRAKAVELLRVSAADSLKREAEREAYQQRRQRKAAYELALKRERRRNAIRKSGQPIPADLTVQPWEHLILQEGREGKVSGVSNTGKRQRQQGGQQGSETMNYSRADAMATAVATATATSVHTGASATAAASAAAAATASIPVTGPPSVAFVVRTDSHGALSAMQDAFARILEQAGTQVSPRIVHMGVGDVTEKDIEYADTMKAHVVAFNAKVPSTVQKLADRKKLTITSGRVIYHVLDSICELLGDYLPKKEEEETVGAAEVKAVFDLNANKKGDPNRVAGCVITEGVLNKHANKYRVVRVQAGSASTIPVQVFEGTGLSSLKIFKDNVESVAKGKECGLSVEGFQEYVVGDKVLAIKSNMKKQKVDVKFG